MQVTQKTEAKLGGVAHQSMQDPLLASLFLGVAAIILAAQNPIYSHFEARRTETWIAVGIGLALLVWANLRGNGVILGVGTVVLLVTAGAGVMTQPVQLVVPPGQVWPLRLLIALLVAFSWAFLLQPPDWLRRAVLAVALPSCLLLLFIAWPSLSAQLFGTRPPVLRSNNFAPYWLARDNRGTLYATDLDGKVVWAFDSAGNPQGALAPANAPPVPTPGPGILPSGAMMESSSVGLMPAATPSFGPAAPPRGQAARFDFCGIATDTENNLYMLDLFDIAGYQILRFDAMGNITARWPVPNLYQPTSGCIATDSDHIYLAALDHSLHVLDDQGVSQRRVKLPFQPFGLVVPQGKVTDPADGLLAIGPDTIAHVNVETGAVTSSVIPTSTGQLQVPALLRRNGEMLMTDHAEGRLVRFDLKTGKVLGTLGKAGPWPGEFGDIGGLEEDDQGKLYVSDYRHRVIQKFDASGKIDAIWYAPKQSGESEAEGEGE